MNLASSRACQSEGCALPLADSASRSDTLGALNWGAQGSGIYAEFRPGYRCSQFVARSL